MLGKCFFDRVFELYLEGPDALEEEDVSDVELDLPDPWSVEVDRVLDVPNMFEG